MAKELAYKVIATEQSKLVAEYIFAVKEEADTFYYKMLSDGYEVVVFEIKI
tara:strand:- start:4650 stop:4802 length:153 start_codon:yes stop_codon:yes gene_type:complete